MGTDHLKKKGSADNGKEEVPSGRSAERGSDDLSGYLGSLGIVSSSSFLVSSAMRSSSRWTAF